MSDNRVQITVEFDVHGRPKIVDAGGQVRKLGDESDRTAGRMRRMESASVSLERTMRTLAVAIAALGIVWLAGSFIDAARTTENYQVRLRALLGSVAEGNRLFDEMSKYAQSVPFEFEQIMGAATALSGVVRTGVNDIAAWIPLIGDLAAAHGFSIEEMTQQFIKMYSGGAAAADMMRERGVSAALGFQAGVSYSAEETRRKLWEEWTKAESHFRGVTKELAKTWDGLMSMASDQWFQFRNQIMGAGLFDFLKLELAAVVDLTKNWGEENNELIAQKIMEYVLGLADAGLALTNVLIQLPTVWADVNFAVNRGVDAALKAAKAYIWLETAMWRFAGAVQSVNPSKIIMPVVGETIDANIQTGERIMKNLDAMIAAADEHGVELMIRAEKAKQEAAASKKLLDDLRKTIHDPKAPAEKEPYTPTHTPSFVDPAAEAAKRLELEKKLAKEINQARMGTYEYKRWALQQEVADLEKEYGKQAIITQYYEAEMAKIAKDEREKGGKASASQAKKLAQERLKLQQELTDETRRLTMTETDYQLWALEQQVSKYRAKYGEMTETNEYEAAKRQKILEQKLEAEREFAVAVAELNDDVTARELANIEKRKEAFIQAGIDRAKAEKLAAEESKKVIEEHSTTFSSAWAKSIEDINKNKLTGEAAFNSLASIGSNAINRLNGVLLDNEMTIQEWGYSVVRQLADVALQMAALGLVGWAGGGGFSRLFETTVWSSGTGMSWIMHGGGRVGTDGTPRQVPNWLFHNAPRLHDGLRWDEWPVILQQGEEVKSRADVAKGKADDGETKSLLRGILAAVQNGMTVRNINVYERPKDWIMSSEGQQAVLNIVSSNRNALPS